MSFPLEPPQPIRGVIFDLHSTLIDQGSADEWLDSALVRAPVDLAPQERNTLVDFLDLVWENARVHDPDSRRDLDPVLHEEVFHALIDDGPGIDQALATALYTTLLDAWHAYTDAVPTLIELRSLDLRIGIISNVGVSIRPILEREGLLEHVDGVTLSCEIGCVKPDARIFHEAANAIGCAPASVLMVGDSGKDDAGAAHIGMRTLILPRTRGPVHGLGVVPALVRATR
ncbi:MAG: HAD family hydrolase [Actinobacteria bacterium]|nr:HAD family hydrolase [Actinomycetota bacterium]